MSRKIISSSALYFGLIARQMNVKSQAPSLIKRTGILPGGFPYTAFNGAAIIKPEAVMGLIETTRAHIFAKRSSSENSYLDVDKLYKDYFLFIMAASVEMNNKLYDSGVCKGPLAFDVELEHIGKSSTQLKTSLFLEDIPEPLVVSRISTVSVSNKTRKPTAPPQWWLDKYKSCVQTGGKSLGKLALSGGERSLGSTSQVKVSLGDVDPYRHTNWSNYIRFCHEAFGRHQIDRLGSDGYNVYFNSCIKDFSVLYLKESSVDDLLTVTVSPENLSSNDDTFYFEITNERQEVVCQSKIQYHKSQA